MDETQDETAAVKPASGNAVQNLPKGGVRLSDLAEKRAKNLRANMARRKAQSRAREGQEPKS